MCQISFKNKNRNFIIDKNSCSYFFESLINEKNRILNLNDPINFLKAIKGKKEIENIKKAHIYDGVALTKYLFWLKKIFTKKCVTEISGSQKIIETKKKK